MDNPILFITLVQLLKSLAQARKKEAAASKAKQDWLDARPEWQFLEAEHKTARETAALADEEVRKAAVGIFSTTGITTPHPLVKIKQFRSLEYDRGEMVTWCRGNAPALLTLDDKAFDAFVKSAAQVPPGVVVVMEPKATIARDLSALEGSEGTEQVV